MQIDMDDVTVFIYNYAIVLTAAYTTVIYGVQDRFALLGVGFLFALFWTGYFRYSMRPRLVRDESDTDDA